MFFQLIFVGFVVDFGEIIYTSQGLIDAMRTKSLRQVFNGLAISIQKTGEQNSKHESISQVF